VGFAVLSTEGVVPEQLRKNFLRSNLGVFSGKCRELSYVDSTRLANRRKLLYASRLRWRWSVAQLTNSVVKLTLRKVSCDLT